MKEISFRVPMICQNGHKSYWFYVVTKKTIDGSITNTKDVMTASQYNPKCKCPKHSINEGWSTNGDPELYIGIKSCKGKKIYENDIVDGYCGKHLIKWGDIIGEGFGFYWEPLSHMSESITGFIDEYEVIGNTYMNPEILK